VLQSFTSIVGPNGSGKSNVIDSMLFVFGFRASKMRQGKVSELIHNSAKFPDCQMCSVAVHFVDIIDLVRRARGFPSFSRHDLAYPLQCVRAGRETRSRATTMRSFRAPRYEEEALDKRTARPPHVAHKPVALLHGTACRQLVVTRTATKSNKSQYYVNDKASNFTEVTDLLKARGIDLDHKRFLILQGEVEAISQMKPKAPSEHEDGLLEYLEDIIGTSALKHPIEEKAKELEALSEERSEKLNRVKIIEKDKEALEVRVSELPSMCGSPVGAHTRSLNADRRMRVWPYRAKRPRPSSTCSRRTGWSGSAPPRRRSSYLSTRRTTRRRRCSWSAQGSQRD